MVGEIPAALASLKTAFDIAKGLQELKREGDIKQAISEIQGALMDAQSRALDAQARETALVEEINRLKTQIAGFEDWEREKKRYELYEPTGGVHTYALKDRPAGGEHPMQFCPNCYHQRQISILQFEKMGAPRAELLVCPRCGTELFVSGHQTHDQRKSRVRRPR
ncbi:hypothetical protein [Thalassobaculum sp.]|uniref:hypothetical protein n=1 Tax=Thalassobaculum sp. TaxID=2022740 RepID=UPI003B5AEEFA